MEESLDFDLSFIPPQERFQFWHDGGSRIHRPIQIQEQPADALMVHAQLQVLGEELVLGRMTASPQRFERTPGMIRKDHVDSFLLMLLDSGSMHWAGDNAPYHVQAGDLFLLNQQDCFQSEWSRHHQFYAALPRDLLKAAGWATPQTGVLRAGDPRAILLSQHLRALCTLPASGSAGLKRELALGLASLSGLYFRDQAPLQAAALEDSRSALLFSIRQWLDSNLHRGDLDAAAIAIRFHLSRSTLYELFRPWGGVRAYLQARRLERAREMLEAAGQRISISQLAIRLGFRSLSCFSRAFRERWGVSPKQAGEGLLTEGDSEPRLAEDEASTVAEGNADRLRQNAQRYYSAVRQLSGGEA